MAVDITQGYLSNILRRGASLFPHSTHRRTSSANPGRFARPLLSTSTNRAKLSSSITGTAPEIETARAIPTAHKPEPPGADDAQSAAPLPAMTSHKPNDADGQHTPPQTQDKAPVIEHSQASLLQHPVMNEIDATIKDPAINETEIVQSSQASMPHRGTQSLDNEPNRSALLKGSPLPTIESEPARRSAIESHSSDGSPQPSIVENDAMRHPVVEGQSTPSPREAASQRTIASKNLPDPESASDITPHRHILAAGKSSLNVPAGETFTTEIRPRSLARSSWSQADKASVKENENFLETPVSPQSVKETGEQGAIANADDPPSPRLTKPTKEPSRIADPAEPATKMEAQASALPQQRMSSPESSSSRSLARPPQKNRALHEKKGALSVSEKAEAVEGENIMRDEPHRHRVVAASTAQTAQVSRDAQASTDAQHETLTAVMRDEVIRVPRARPFTRTRVSLGELAGGSAREAASAFVQSKGAEAERQSTAAALPEKPVVDNSASTPVIGPKKELQAVHEDAPVQLHQPRLRETSSRQESASRRENAPGLSIKRLDVRVVNQNQTAPPKREPRPRDAKQSAEKGLDRHYLGRYHLNF